MWQLVLLLGMLTIAATYLLHRQFAHVFYAANKIDDDELEEQDKLSSFAIGENNDALREGEVVRIDEINEKTALQNVSQTTAAVESNEIIAVDDLSLENAGDIEQIEIKAEHEFPWENEKSAQQSETAEISELPSVAATDEQQVEVAESGFPWETVDNNGINEAEEFAEWPFETDTNVTSSTNMPFAELPPIVTPEMEENLAVVPDGAQEMAARDGEENPPHISPEEWIMSTDSSVKEKNGVEWDDILSEVTQQPLFSDNELKEKADAAMQEAQTAEWNIDELPQEEQSDWSGEEAIEAKENDVGGTDRVSVISPVHSELLQTVVAELQLNRKYMDPLQYEQRIIQCLQTPLSDYDYYVFACLLIEHYLLEKQYDKLASLLAQLQEKFRSYPIIKEELQFLAHILQKL